MSQLFSKDVSRQDGSSKNTSDLLTYPTSHWEQKMTKNNVIDY